MLSILMYVVNSLVPMLLIMALGYYLRTSGFFSPQFVTTGVKFAFKITAPAQLFIAVYGIKGLDEIDPVFVVACLVSLFALMGIGWLMARFLIPRRDRKAVMIQSTYRSNFAVLGVILVNALVGQEGVSLAAVGVVFAVTLYNISAVFWLSIYSPNGSGSFRIGKVLKDITKNSMIRGIFAGLACVIIRQFIPLGADGLPVFTLKTGIPFLYSAIDKLSTASPTVLLLFLGGQLVFDEIKDFKKELILCVTGRCVISPIVGFAICAAVYAIAGVPQTASVLAVETGLFCTPLAVVTSAMCLDMGSDHKLAAQTVAWSSVFSFFTMAVVVFILRATGIV